MQGLPGFDTQRGTATSCNRQTFFTMVHTSVVGLAGDVLVGDQVHAVAQAGHESDVRHRVQRAQLVECQLPLNTARALHVRY